MISPIFCLCNMGGKGFSKQFIKASVQEKVSIIAIPGDNNFAVVHVPRSWAGKRIFAMTSEYYNELKGKQASQTD